ncbi:hypothetical protein Leryth_024592 [Lithospermum erythrorhizon]|nr:hypothetical protein Leryth_024592 [Lithospermum erythrorhizon]
MIVLSKHVKFNTQGKTNVALQTQERITSRKALKKMMPTMKLHIDNEVVAPLVLDTTGVGQSIDNIGSEVLDNLNVDSTSED